VQPLDGGIMFLAYLIYAGQALMRGRQDGESIEWSTKEIGLAVVGVGALAVGSYFIVRATETLAALFGISNVIAGLFITATMSTTPEVFATWAVTRSGQVTSGATGVLTDNAVTMTLAFVPLALVTVTITDFQLYWVNLMFVAVMPIVLRRFSTGV
jgi:cation:H+ antiporter